MAYIGQSIKNGTFSVLDTSGNTYNGSNTTFNLGTQVGSPAQLLVSHDGVIQKAGTDYTLATGGTQITFTTAPASGASIFIVEISGAVGGPMNRDINGDELILDVDGDTSITADTDDQIDFKVGGSDIATINSSGLGLGTTSPSAQLHIQGSDVTDQVLIENTNANAEHGPDLTLYRNSSSPADSDALGNIIFRGRNDNSQDVDYFTMTVAATDVSDTTENMQVEIAGIIDGSNADIMRIDSSGNVMVRKTTANDTDVGITFYRTGKASFTVAGDATIFNRTSDNGNIILLRSAGSNAGIIACHGNHPGDELSISGSGTNTSGVYFSNSNSVLPMKDNGVSDNTQDLGASSQRWDDVYATNGTIQTSDQQEKNTITDSDLGLDFINRLSPKSYIFNGKTRTHYGLIAQDVETVLSDISKTSADFAGFIKTDISEEQDGSSYRYGLRYNEFIAPLIKAVKELKAENDSLKARVTALEG